MSSPWLRPWVPITQWFKAREMYYFMVPVPEFWVSIPGTQSRHQQSCRAAQGSGAQPWPIPASGGCWSSMAHGDPSLACSWSHCPLSCAANLCPPLPHKDACAWAESPFRYLMIISSSQAPSSPAKGIIFPFKAALTCSRNEGWFSLGALIQLQPRLTQLLQLTAQMFVQFTKVLRSLTFKTSCKI